MRKIISIVFIYIIIAFIICGCTMKKDEYFAQKGQYIVECINAQKNAENLRKIVT